MDNYTEVALLGIIEGVTEFLPISSTGHLLIAEGLGLGQRSELFNIVIQAGAIMAVHALYWKRTWALLTGARDPERRTYALKLGAAFVITAVLGVVVKKLGFELPDSITPIAWALIVGGVWMIAAERYAAGKSKSEAVSWPAAVAVGVSQIVAGVFPGTSRSAATIFVGMLFGTTDRKAATEFSFLLGIPTMYAASAYALLKQKDLANVHEDWSALGVAFVASTVTAFVVVRWLLRYLRTHDFTVFAVYRIVLGILLLSLVPKGL